MIEQNNICVKSSFGNVINNMFLKNVDNTKTVVIIFPGANGSVEKPILYYPREVAIGLGCDVLSIGYGYYEANKQYILEYQDDTVEECKEAVEKCLQNGYENIIFISKSLGTAIAGAISKQIGYEKVHNIYLTPIRYTISHIQNSECTVILGKEDKLFSEKYYNEIKDYNNVNIKIIENANHALEVQGHWSENIKILEQVTRECEEFINNIISNP